MLTKYLCHHLPSRQRKAHKASLQQARAKQAACSFKLAQHVAATKSAEQHTLQLSKEIAKVAASLSLLQQQHPEATLPRPTCLTSASSVALPGDEVGNTVAANAGSGADMLCDGEENFPGEAATDVVVRLQSELQVLKKEREKLEREQVKEGRGYFVRRQRSSTSVVLNGKPDNL